MFKFPPLLCGLCTLLLIAPAHAAERVDISHLATNPADAKNSRDERENLAYAGMQLYFDDRDDLLDKALELKEESEALEARSRGFLLIPGDEQDLVAALENLDGATTSLRGDLDLIIAGKQDSTVHYVIGTELRGTARFYYDPVDERRLQLATITGLFHPLDLESYMDVAGIMHSHIGLNMHYQLPQLGNLQIGILAKLQVISLLDRRIDYNDYERGDVFDWGSDIKNAVQPNIDLGLRKQLGRFGLQLVMSDLYTETLYGYNGHRYRQRSRIQAGFDYRRHWGSLQIMGDVVPRPSFGEVSSRRDIRVDGSLRLTRRWELLLGYNDVQEHYERNTGSAGLRYTLGRSLRFDVRGTAAGKRELGFQMGLQLPL